MREAICNTSPLQYLHQTRLLHLLSEFYTRILIPPAVVEELERGRAIGIDLPEIRSLPWVNIRPPRELTAVRQIRDLGAGEMEVLALGLEISSAVMILDERLGRSHAAALRLSFTGTVAYFYVRRPKAESSVLNQY